MVAAGWVDREGADDLAAGGVDNAYVEVVDEHDDAGSMELSAEPDVVQLAGDAEGDVAVADFVVADPVVGLVDAGGGRFGSGVIGRDRGAVAKRAVGSLSVVFVDELVEQCLEFVERGGAGVGGEPAFEGSVGSVRPCRTWWGGWGGCSSG